MTRAVPATIDSPELSSTVEVIANNSVALDCPVSGVPRPSVSWFREEVPIPGNASNVYILDGGRRLHINGVEVGQAGLYVCRAKNVAGQEDKEYTLSVFGLSNFSD